MIIRGKSEGMILLIWGIVQSVLLTKNGLVTTGEAWKYIWQSDNLLNTGNFTSSNFWFYSTQILLISLDKIMNAGFLFVLFIQMALSATSTVFFFRLSSQFVTQRAAFTGTVALSLFYPFQQFNSFLQTESIYFSLSIIFSFYLLRIEKLSLRSGLTIIIFLVLFVFTRPTGLLFIPVTILYLLIRFNRGEAAKWLMGLFFIGLAIFLMILNTAMGSGGELDFMLPFKTGQVICGIPETPETTAETAGNGNSVYGLFYYIIHHFPRFLELSLKKTISFFGLLRNHYSTIHNLYLALYFYPVYILLILSVNSWVKKSPSQFIYILATIVSVWATTIFTCDDWHNRFFLSVSPFILLLSLPFLSRQKASADAKS